MYHRHFIHLTYTHFYTNTWILHTWILHACYKCCNPFACAKLFKVDSWKQLGEQGRLANTCWLPLISKGHPLYYKSNKSWSLLSPCYSYFCTLQWSNQRFLLMPKWAWSDQGGFSCPGTWFFLWTIHALPGTKQLWSWKQDTTKG